VYRKLELLTIVLTVLSLASCGDQSSPADAQSPGRASQIVCNTAYRSSAGGRIEREDSLTFSDSDSQQSLSYGELEFYGSYDAGEQDRERGLRVWVTERGSDMDLTTVLYQLPLDSGPQNQFIGGHGFTGLNYIHHPSSGAELQFWCEAE
jgi:hypothetical protein